jgi:hypothetical protein
MRFSLVWKRSSLAVDEKNPNNPLFVNYEVLSQGYKYCRGSQKKICGQKRGESEEAIS